MLTDILEMGMLLCFACSWPFSIRRSIVSRTTMGKSCVFMIVVIIGYLFGVSAKIVGGDITFVLAFYFLDIGLVATDLALWVRNHRLDKERGYL